MRVRAGIALLLTAACSEPAPGGPSVGWDAGLPAADGGMPACVAFAVNDAPPLGPAPGELYYEQIGLGGLSMGEAALIVGPDGTTILVDTGNDSHDDDVREALASAVDRMTAAGLPARDRRRVDHVVLTHLHADHVDALGALLDSLSVGGRVIHRGFFDVVPGELEAGIHACEALEAHSGLSRALCAGASEASCRSGSWGARHPADDCPELQAGDLSVDGGSGGAYLSLGGARLAFLAADGYISGGSERFDHLRSDDGNGENARSLVALLVFGPFRLLLAGDLTGGGSDTADVEGWYAPRLAQMPDLSAFGVDVLHLSHHARETSSSTAWLDTMLPVDGRARHALAGISTAHVGSPHEPVLERLFAGARATSVRALVTKVAMGGATHERLADADGGSVRVRTEDGGRRYVVQAADSDGKARVTWRAPAVRACE